MTLGRLDVSDVRNIAAAAIELAPGINLVHGDNGSGKTSLLESIYFLGSGRTFRSQSAEPLIRREAAACTVFGVVGNGQTHRIGVRRGRKGEREIHIDGEPASRASELARLLPTLVMGPQSIDLVTGPPSVRRSFLNWGVFHVEPSFASVWERYSRALRQRNQLLRDAGQGLGSWNESLDQMAHQVDEFRRRYAEAFERHFKTVAASLLGEKDVDSRYYRGWERHRRLLDVLEDQEGSDRLRGYTQSGPHRSDIRIKMNGQTAAAVCSRGELKVLSWAMVLAQGALFREVTRASLVYLVDDLAAELDAAHRDRVSELLAKPGNQVVVTGIDRTQLDTGWGDRAPKWFHVEQGCVHEEE